MDNKVQIEKIYNLTSMQQGMLLHDRLDKSDDAYIEQSMFVVKGNLDKDILEETFNRIISRYDVFRTVFVDKGVQEPIQLVLKDCHINVIYEDISNCSEMEKVNYIKKFEDYDRNKKFNLSKAPLTRVSVLKLSEDTFNVVWSFHHIIMDGWCMGILIDEIFKIYNSLVNGEEIELERVYPYSNYIDWLNKQNQDEASKFWGQYLEGYTGCANIIKSNKLESEDKYELKETVLNISKEVTNTLTVFANKCNSTLSNVLQAMWGVILQKYNNTNDVSFGLVVSGRHAEVIGVNSMVGLFINTVPIRIKSTKGQLFKELVELTQNNSFDINKYDYYSLAKIQSQVDSKENLISHIFAFENYPESEKVNNVETLKHGELVIKESRVFEQTNYDFNIIVIPGADLKFKFSYNSLVYEEEFIERLKDHIEMFIKTIINNPDIAVNEIDILPEKEKRIILDDFNDTKVDFEINDTIHELFEKQVKKTPNSIAAVFKNEKLTYKELNERANALARTLLKTGEISKDSIVGIAVERSIEMVIGMLAILKSGAAYLPIDCEYPKERIEYMLSDSRMKILLTETSFLNKVNFEGKVIDIRDNKYYDFDTSNINKDIELDSLAYIIYTSGTTGNPKGVMIEQRNLINLCKWHIREYGVTENDRATQYASIGFDACVWEIWPYLISGSMLFIIPNDLRVDIKRLNDFYNKNHLTISFLPTQVCQSFMTLCNNDSLRILLTGGDKLKIYTDTKYKLVNNYGPTENTVVTTNFYIDEIMNNIPIGKPINNTKVYILDNENRALPIGVYGELCISGDGVARGYLNREDLTKEKFIQNPYDNNRKMYKTGDLARWLPNGDIEFKGRIDNQVKIRGFRIELGDIESVLLQLNGVKEAAVIDIDKANNKYLCAYIVKDEEINNDYLKEQLSKKLPYYMIPSYYEYINHIPLTQNGKVDKKKLPSININSISENTKAENEIEGTLVNIWKDVLNIDSLGIDDNFFDIGGNSLLVINLHSQIGAVYGDKIKVTDIFSNPTVKKLASFIEKSIKITSNKCEVEKMIISPNYFVDSTNSEESLILEYEIDEITYKILSSISVEQKVDIEVLLLCINLYTYSRICAKGNPILYSELNTNNKVNAINIDFSNINDFNKLFEMVRNCLKSNDFKQYEVNSLCNVAKERNSIMPLFCMNNLKNSLNNIFDVIIDVQNKGTTLKITCNYDNSRVKGEKISQVFNSFIKIVKTIAESYV